MNYLKKENDLKWLLEKNFDEELATKHGLHAWKMRK